MLIFHGTVVLLIGLLAGFPFLFGIVRDAPPRSVDAWRAAHTGLSSTGVMAIAMGAALAIWQAGGPAVTVATWGITIGAYGIALAMTLAAATGSRGLVAGGPASNHVVYASYMTGVPATLIGAGAFLWIAADQAF
jgi:hypothetical protein